MKKSGWLGADRTISRLLSKGSLRQEARHGLLMGAPVPRVIRALSDRGVALVIPRPGHRRCRVPTNTPEHVLEFKAAIATERTTHGMARRAKRRGVKLGRPRILDVHRGEVARLRAAGMTGRGIAKELGLPQFKCFPCLASERAARVV
jgi:hypothetical protein